MGCVARRQFRYRSSPVCETSVLPASIQVQIVLVEPNDRGALIDALAIQDDHSILPAPLTLDVHLPATRWAIAAAVALERWAVEGATVTMNFSWQQGRRRVSILDDRHYVAIDLRRWPVGVQRGQQARPETPLAMQRCSET